MRGSPRTRAVGMRKKYTHLRNVLRAVRGTEKMQTVSSDLDILSMRNLWDFK